MKRVTAKLNRRERAIVLALGLAMSLALSRLLVPEASLVTRFFLLFLLNLLLTLTLSAIAIVLHRARPGALPPPPLPPPPSWAPLPSPPAMFVPPMASTNGGWNRSAWRGAPRRRITLEALVLVPLLAIGMAIAFQAATGQGVDWTVGFALVFGTMASLLFAAWLVGSWGSFASPTIPPDRQAIPKEVGLSPCPSCGRVVAPGPGLFAVIVAFPWAVPRTLPWLVRMARPPGGTVDGRGALRLVWARDA